MSKNLFEIDLDNIDVESIMTQIRQKIQQQGIVEEDIKLTPLASDKDASLDEGHLLLVNMTYHIDADKPITSHRKYKGKFIVFGKKVVRKFMSWYIHPIVEQQNDFNAHVTRTLNNVNKQLEGDNKDNTEKHIKQMQQSLEAGMQELNALQQKIDTIKEELSNVYVTKEELSNIYVTKEELSNVYVSKEELSNVHVTKEELFNVYVTKEELSNGHVSKEELSNVYVTKEGLLHVYNIKEELEAENSYISSRLRRIERRLKYKGLTVEEPEYITTPMEQIDYDYFLFEERYRGKEEEIKKRLEIYLPYFYNQENVVDIGCGRGEFLEILKENNISAKGIDTDEDMFMICQEKGLTILRQDALTYLKEQEDGTLGGIILTQVVEHLSPNSLIELIRLAYDKLKPGAYFIAETINPQSLIVFTEAYFMDLSHIRMIHPLTLKFLVGAEGFKEIETKYLSPVGDDMKVPQVEGLPEAFNTAINKLNGVMYGCRDYAVIGRK